MERYNFAEKEILIYGAGSLGITCYRILKKVNISVAAYIDKRADTLKEYEGCRVCAFDELKDWKEKDRYCIVIAIRNVFEHSQLALRFYKLGFRALIYKPTTVLRGKNNPVFSSINEAHDSLMVRFEAPKEPVLYYEKEKLFEARYDLFLPCSRENFYKVYVPSELLFSNIIPRYLWTERNFVSNYVGVELYKAFSGVGDLKKTIEKYINRFALPGALDMGVDVSGAWKDILIDSRLAVYNEMRKKMSVMPDFFVKNCTVVDLRENGGFKLIASGKNRVSFLIAQGYRYIPVMINKEDYDEARQIEYVRKIEIYLSENGITQLNVPIPHFFFYDLDYLLPQYIEQWQSQVGYLLAEMVYSDSQTYDFGGYSVVDYSTDDGSMSRFLSMMGFCVERKMKQNDLMILLDGLLRVSCKGSHEAKKLACVISDLTGNVRIDKDAMKCSICFLLEYEDQSSRLYADLGDNYIWHKEILHTFWNGRYVTGRIFGKEEIGNAFWKS